MVFDRLEDEDAPSRYSVIRQTAPTLGVAVETLRRWVEQANLGSRNTDEGAVAAQAEIRKLKRENAELRRANAILKTASAYFAAELDRPSAQ
jgi:transposase